MILPGNASLVLSAVQQLIKLGNRIDQLMAQRTAVEAQLVLGMPGVRLGSILKQRAIVQKALDATEGQSPDPLAPDRAALRAQLALPQPEPVFDALFQKHFPEQDSQVFSPDAAFLTQLREKFPRLDWNDPALRIAALAIAAGHDKNQISYNARLALAVADTLLEFGAENAALFVHEPKWQGLIQSVLQRFAQPDWAGFEQWNPLLQTALTITLNAALDVGAQLPAKNPWLDGVLDALVQARAAATQPDDFLLGLLQGEGVPLLLSRGVLVATHKLDESHASPFKAIAVDVLTAAAPFIQQQTNPQLARFFRDHWGDLLRAGLTSLERHGDALLTPASPLLKNVLLALVQQLSTTPNANFLSSEMLHQLADTAIGVVAKNPTELAGLDRKPWLRDLLAAAAQSAQQLTAKKLFTAEAADALLRDALAVLAQHPELVVGNKPLPLTLARSIFAALAQFPPDQFSRADVRALGGALLAAALDAVATNPALVTPKFESILTALATQLADAVRQKQFSSAQAVALARVAIAALGRNPKLFTDAQAPLASAAISAVQQAFAGNSAWASPLLVATAEHTLVALARHGGAVAAQPIAQLQPLLVHSLTAGLALAAHELGTSTDLAGIPPILGELVAQALRGELTALDAASPLFAEAFKAAAARRLA